MMKPCHFQYMYTAHLQTQDRIRIFVASCQLEREDGWPVTNNLPPPLPPQLVLMALHDLPIFHDCFAILVPDEEFKNNIYCVMKVNTAATAVMFAFCFVFVILNLLE